MEGVQKNWGVKIDGNDRQSKEIIYKSKLALNLFSLGRMTANDLGYIFTVRYFLLGGWGKDKRLADFTYLYFF